MDDKKIKEAMKKYIADNNQASEPENFNLSSLDNKVFASINRNTVKKTAKHRPAYIRVALVAAVCAVLAAMLIITVLLPLMNSGKNPPVDPILSESEQEDETSAIVAKSYFANQAPEFVQVELTTDGLPANAEELGLSLDSVNGFFGHHVVILNFDCGEENTVIINTRKGITKECYLWKCDIDPHYMVADNINVIRQHIDCIDGLYRDIGYPAELGGEYYSGAPDRYFQLFSVIYGDEITDEDRVTTINGNGYVQYCYPRDTAEEDYIDFTVVNPDGEIIGAGSVYVGIYDTGLQGSIIGFDENDYKICRRGVILDSVRFDLAEDRQAPMTEEEVAAEILAMHGKTAEKSADLFENLDEFWFSEMLAFIEKNEGKPITFKAGGHRARRNGGTIVVSVGEEQKTYLIFENGYYVQTDGTFTPVIDQEMLEPGDVPDYIYGFEFYSK